MHTFPSPAEEELADVLNVQEFVITKPQSSFLIKMDGESMIEAGIRPNDLVVFERGRAPVNGDIVVAEVDGRWVMRFFEKRAGRVVLLPGNKTLKPLLPQQELKLAGVVVSVVRKYY